VRIDRLLVERGLVPSRERAQRLLMAGEVWSTTGSCRSPAPVRDDASSACARRPVVYASRAAARSSRAPSTRSASILTGSVVLDVGASTGGFTDVCLRRGARAA
jgi:23S rRNA (cytidine1920-2'-O)/16S rRNA (cytidine1409-2'-O)-methyltransferase